MAGIITNSGFQDFLNILFGATAKPAGLTIKLVDEFAYGLTSESDTPATHTLVTGGGYADKALGSNIVITAADGGGYKVTWNPVVWEFTGPIGGSGFIVGYQVYNGTTLLFEEKFNIEIQPLYVGDIARIVPSVTLKNAA